MIDLKAIEERCEGATKGKWEITFSNQSYEIAANGHGIVTAYFGIEDFRDADFIAHSREDIPELLRLVLEARAIIQFCMEGDTSMTPENVDKATRIVLDGEKWLEQFKGKS
jgi:hypothetical protein